MSVLQDLTHSLRLLRRTPGFSAVAIGVLALGIGVNAAVFSVVNTLVLQPRPGRIDRVVAVFSRDRVKPDTYRDFSYPAYLDLRDRSGAFEQLMAHSFSTVGIREGDITTQTFASVVSANYFKTLGVTLAAGRAFSADEERPGAGPTAAIASYSVWRRHGLAPDFVGSTIRANGRVFTVVGVAPRGFGGTMTLVSPQWWFPLGSYDVIVNEMFKQRASGLTDRGNYALNLAGALKPGLSAAAGESALNAVSLQLEHDFPATDRDQTLSLGHLSRMGVSSQPQSDTSIVTLSSLLMLMAALVLLVACLNLANLLLARGAARRREIAIRQALGSSRSRIVRQLLVEGLTLSIAGAAIGLVIGVWTTRALSAWLGGALPLGIDVIVEPSARMLAAGAVLAAFSTIGFAAGPAWSLSRPALAGDLKGEPASGVRRIGTGPWLLVIQLAMSLALVAAGGLFVRAAARAARADFGFPVEGELVVGLDPSLAGYDETRVRSTYRAVLARLRAMAGVEGVSFASTVPLGSMTEGKTVRRNDSDQGVHAIFVVVGSGYFETLRMPMLRGREFTAGEDEPGRSARIAIVDRRLAARVFGDADPVGQPIRLAMRDGDGAESFTIVGVAPEMRHNLFEDAPEPHVYVPYGQRFNTIMNVHVRLAAGVEEAAMLASIRRELQAVDAQLPILSIETMELHRDRSLQVWAVRAAATMFSAFGSLALLLATIGVYGLKAYDVSRRTREIGIRMALGATAADVERLVMREGARTTAAGLAIGLLLAAAIGKLVSGLLYRVSPFDPAVLALAAAVLSGAAMLACYVPARRATRVVPLEALRAE
jgi:putative ABC transport system permease protein